MSTLTFKRSGQDGWGCVKSTESSKKIDIFVCRWEGFAMWNAALFWDVTTNRNHGWTSGNASCEKHFTCCMPRLKTWKTVTGLSFSHGIRICSLLLERGKGSKVSNSFILSVFEENNIEIASQTLIASTVEVRLQNSEYATPQQQHWNTWSLGGGVRVLDVYQPALRIWTVMTI